MKNEADRYLPQVLESISKVADKIVITDDGSTDDSVKIARLYTDIIYELGSSSFEEHEGKLRQIAWDNLCNHAKEDDWILCIDADEVLYTDHLKLPFETLMKQTRYHVLGVRFFHMWNENQFRVDKAWMPNVGSRIFRFKENGSFADRKLACGSEPSYIQQWIRERRFMVDSGFDIKHLGYLTDEDKQMKYERYMKLDHGDYHSLAHIKSIIDPNPTLVDWYCR
jgi:glycosyltransferase involved in cell wall biosynthesis